MLRLSDFVHFFPHHNMLWHSLKFTRIILEAKVFDYLLKNRTLALDQLLFSPELSQKLRDLGMIASAQQDKSDLEAASKIVLNKQVQGLYLILTFACNLRCSYCLYNSAASRSIYKKRPAMSQDLALRAVDFFLGITADNNKDLPGYWQQITMYGGEPLLNSNVVKEIALYITSLKAQQKLWQNTSLVLNTNGLLIDDDFARFAADHHIEVQISVDGIKEVHDKYRKTEEAQPTFEKVTQALYLLSKYQVKVIPMVTLTTESSFSLQDLLLWLNEEFDLNEYAANLLMNLSTKIDGNYPIATAKALIHAYKKRQQLGIEDSAVTALIESMSHPEIATEYCGAGKKLTVFPNGQLHACQSLEQTSQTYLGDDLSFNTQSDTWQNWLGRSRFKNSTCLKCPVLGLCGGGCASSAFNTFGNINAIDPNYCAYIKYIFQAWLSGEI